MQSRKRLISKYIARATHTTLFFDGKYFFLFKKWHKDLRKYWLLVCIVLWACAKAFRQTPNVKTSLQNIIMPRFVTLVQNPLNRLFSSATEAAAFLIFQTSHSLLLWFWKLFCFPNPFFSYYLFRQTALPWEHCFVQTLDVAVTGTKRLNVICKLHLLNVLSLDFLQICFPFDWLYWNILWH